MRKAIRYKPDALLFDLEDAVPVDRKQRAREDVAAALEELKGEPVALFVRTNAWRSGELLKDMQTVMVEGLDGVMLPKVSDPEEVAALDLVMGELESARGLTAEAVEISPLAETARGLYLTHEICLASARVKRAGTVIVATPGGDYPRALNLRLHPDGRESVAIGQFCAMAARAAGVSHVLGGMTTEIDNLDLVRQLSEQSKDLGATGALTIHPSHVPILNSIYAPSTREVDEARQTLTVMADAIAGGAAAVRLGAKMVDYAHVRSALELLATAKQFGLDVGEVPHVDVIN
jgi:citrate lyase subunit beta/citryl-CoA lyase